MFNYKLKLLPAFIVILLLTTVSHADVKKYDFSNSKYSLSDSEINRMTNQVSVPLMASLSFSIYTIRSFIFKKLKPLSQATLNSKILKLKQKLKKTWEDAKVYIQLAELHAANRQKVTSNTLYKKAVVLLKKRLADNDQDYRAREVLAKVYFEILMSNQANPRYVKKYVPLALQINNDSLNSSHSKQEIYYRLGIINFIFLNKIVKSNKHFEKASVLDAETFEYNFLYELSELFVYFYTNREKNFKKLCSKPITDVFFYNYQKIKRYIERQVRQNEKGEEIRYRVLFRFSQFIGLFFKAYICDGRRFFDIKQNLKCYNEAEKKILNKVIELFKKADENNTIDKELNYKVLGMTYYIKRDMENTLTYYNKAFAINPGDKDIMQALVFFYGKILKQYGKAVNVIQKKIKHSGAIKDYIWLASMQYKNGSYSNALESISYVLKFSPRNAQANLLAAMIHLKKEKYKKADMHANAALQYKPKKWMFLPNVCMIKAVTSLALEKPKIAFSFAQRAYKADPQDKRIRWFINRYFQGGMGRVK